MSSTKRNVLSDFAKVAGLCILVPTVIAFVYLIWGAGVMNTLVGVVLAGAFGVFVFEKRPVIGAILGALVMSALIFVPPRLLLSEVEFNVVESERIVTGKGETTSSKYLVFTDLGAEAQGEKGESFENVDSFPFLKFDSSDLAGQFMGLKGKRVKAQVYGFRIPLFSSYRNIISVNAVD